MDPFPVSCCCQKPDQESSITHTKTSWCCFYFFSLLCKTIVFSTKKPAKVSKYWILIWQKVKLSFQLSNTAKFYKLNHTLFEYYSECLIWHFPPIFVPLKLTCLVTLFDLQIDYFKSRIWIFCHFLPCYDLSGNTFWSRTSANFLQWLPDGQGVE